MKCSYDLGCEAVPVMSLADPGTVIKHEPGEATDRCEGCSKMYCRAHMAPTIEKHEPESDEWKFNKGEREPVRQPQRLRLRVTKVKRLCVTCYEQWDGLF